jgi:hypothetical protein
MTDLSAVTRIQIKTELGLYNFWADSWETEVKDDHRTLFLRGRGEGDHARTQRDIETQARLTNADQSEGTS